MRIAELLRKMADIVDQAEQGHPANGQMSPLSKGDDPNRFKQVMDLISSEKQGEYENNPKEEYADMASVTIHAGGGVNGPKHPHDLRVKDPSQHSGQQEF
jgi:hypothetical protein